MFPGLARILAGKGSVVPQMEEEEMPQPSTPPMIPPTEDIASILQDGPALKDYQAHMQNMPRQEDYKLGTLGNIAAILAGAAKGFVSKDPVAGFETTRMLKNRNYNEALSRHQMEGEGKRAAAEIEGRSQNNRVRAYDYESRAKDRKEDNERQAAAEKSRHEEAMARAKNAEERNAEVTRHNQEMEKMSGRRASASERTARAAETSAGARVMDAETRRKKGEAANTPKTPRITDQQKADDVVSREMAAEDPNWRKFVTINKNTGRVVTNMDAANKDPEGYELFVAMKERRKRKMLGVNNDIALPQPDDVEPVDDDERYEFDMDDE